ncbi:hypothetical protein Asp14428_16060 [Actinoplanes sp. NBRC 14428]|nr:hypothetical protein Asp14428_16060 [Actinoplanes sp. NBRC 14428]
MALHRLTEIIFELKINNRFAMNAAANPATGAPRLDPEVLNGLDLLFTRLHAAGVITAAGPAWCRGVFLALLHEVDQLPADAPVLAGTDGGTGARIDLLARTVIGALDGSAGPA